MQLSRCARTIVTALVLSTVGFVGDAEARTADAAPAKVGARSFGANAVVLDHFMVSAENPRFIIPCVRVIRQLFEASRTDRSLTVEVRASYTSGGRLVEQVFVLSLADFELSDHHPQPRSNRWRLLDATVDLGELPIDPGSEITGSVTLLGGNDHDDDDDDDDHDDDDHHGKGDDCAVVSVGARVES